MTFLAEKCRRQVRHWPLDLQTSCHLANVDHLLWSCCPTIAGTMMATSGSPDAGPIRKTAPLLVQHHCLWVCSTGMRIKLEPWPMSIANTDHYNCRQSISLIVANISHLCVPSVAIGWYIRNTSSLIVVPWVRINNKPEYGIKSWSKPNQLLQKHDKLVTSINQVGETGWNNRNTTKQCHCGLVQIEWVAQKYGGNRWPS